MSSLGVWPCLCCIISVVIVTEPKRTLKFASKHVALLLMRHLTVRQLPLVQSALFVCFVMTMRSPSHFVCSSRCTATAWIWCLTGTCIAYLLFSLSRWKTFGGHTLSWGLRLSGRTWQRLSWLTDRGTVNKMTWTKPCCVWRKHVSQWDACPCPSNQRKFGLLLDICTF